MAKEYILREGKQFILNSSFENGSIIPKRFTCDADNISPELRWSDSPDAKSYALILYDPDAPMGTFIHWVIYNIKGNLNRLYEAVPKKEFIEEIGKQGRNDFGEIGYGGPCPPRGHGFHRYYFALHALNVESLNIKGEANAEKLLNSMKGKVIGYAVLMGKYSR
ncbi:MAG: YbhB/YbcL family Raf kinase inhibitor-like protein [Caldisphaera sp.]|jgi:Raf kinase inhibitor-like YbhB/YbcL family protein|nr:MAG: YbhB/YbcL family Raf kinase inhibitor-like protein [Caldisphaera sp.]PMP87793.1 MAG: YbhB/YbcL family Raf kinase inhibitor-like protein [Caldisphaera sp.]